MEDIITLHIKLLSPTVDVIYGLQKGAGNNYETIQKQSSVGKDLVFTFHVKIKGERGKDSFPKLSGPFVQGPADAKFIYIDIGTSAGDIHSPWTRRLKIPLRDITWNDIDQLLNNAKVILEAAVPGSGKDGSPNCATVKPFEGWHIKKL